ncbi:MAG TPA: NAD(P)-dependent oxidoreductase [Dokdonella sp.]|uniref:NAD(P)-dependent oxidoreductase n=1 Tax=Dokdonella sp. TaxID=2291710 RepID=UPI002D7F17F8|nr:NAD(P)-dependent oxidoreductase [Dokdonella sp.]HET9033295.1 NAD(P)-dependent oxidoreductase [Dokdonella sp.]
MPLFPIFANLESRDVLVAGGGEVAQRKIEALFKAGARIRIYANDLNATLAEWQDEGRLERLQGRFDANWLDRVWLVVAATDDRAFNRELAKEAHRRQRLINVVDDAELSTFHVPAIVDRDPLQIAISSGGSAPMLARRLRERLETDLDESLGMLASMFASNREAIRIQFPDLAQRRRWFDHVLDGPLPLLLQDGQIDKAAQLFSDLLARGLAEINIAGQVVVVDVSHADPGLLTLKAQRAMNITDLLVFDAGINQQVLDRARRDASQVEAPNDDLKLTSMLIASAKKGHHVVYLTAESNAARLAELRLALDQQAIGYQLVPPAINP